METNLGIQNILNTMVPHMEHLSDLLQKFTVEQYIGPIEIFLCDYRILLTQKNMNIYIFEHLLTVLNQWNGKEISMFPSYDYVLTTDASESGAGATLKKKNKIIKTWSFQWSTTQSNMSSNRREMFALLIAYSYLRNHKIFHQ
ncbi:hypothetical protein ACTFIW_003760 [Dictyostelium discoideum]